MRLALPPQGALVPNDEHDPLPYYYRPLTGWLYRKRLTMALSLLPAGTSKQHVLEVGVGSGILIPTLSAAFDSYTGTDLVLAKGIARLAAPTCKARRNRPRLTAAMNPTAIKFPSSATASRVRKAATGEIRCAKSFAR